MLIIDVAEHSVMEMPPNGTETPCMFQLAKDKFKLKYHALNMHWSVLIPPSILLGIGQLIVTTSTLEFISAQCPHSMKGILVGIIFAIQGFFSTDWICFHTSTLFPSSSIGLRCLLWLVVDLFTYCLQAL